MNYAKPVILILVLFISNAYSTSLQSRCEQLFANALKEGLSPKDQKFFVDVANLIGGKEKDRMLDELLNQNPWREVLEKINDSVVEIGGTSGIRILERINDNYISKVLEGREISPEVIKEVAVAAIQIGGKPGVQFFTKLLEMLLPKVQDEILSYMDKIRFLTDLLKQALSPKLRKKIVTHVAFDAHSGAHNFVSYRSQYETNQRMLLLKELLENNPSPKIQRIIIRYIFPGPGMVSYRNSVAYLRILLEMKLSPQAIEAIAKFANENPKKKDTLLGLINEIEQQFRNAEELMNHFEQKFRDKDFREKVLENYPMPDTSNKEEVLAAANRLKSLLNNN